MISFEEAFKLLKKKHPGIYIKNTFDYKSKYYCFTAFKDPSNTREMDPFYAVDKETGDVNRFAPMEDFVTFSKILDSSRELNDKL